MITGNRVAIGTENPVKISAVVAGFNAMYPLGSILFDTVSVPSGVDEQPMDGETTLRGAIERAKRVQSHTSADMGIGLESGINCILGEWYCIGWVTIANRSGALWSAQTTGIKVPDAVMELVHKGMGLGAADDKFFGLTDSKKTLGMSGIVTGGKLTRLDAFRAAVIAAIGSMQLDCKALEQLREESNV